MSPKGDAHLISRWMLLTTTSTFALVAQLDRAFACGAKGRTFESCRVYQSKKEGPEGLVFYYDERD